MEKPQKRRRVSVADVARACAVSTATVSYVLNDTPGHTISAETRRRVREAADHLGYVPNSTAKALRRGRTQIALLDVSRFVEGAGNLALAQAFSERLRAAGITVITRSAHSTPLELHELAAAVSPFAVASLTAMPAEEEQRLRQAGVRYVSGWDFGTRPHQATPAWVHASRQAQVRHLAGAGHTRVAYAHHPDPAARELSEDRARGAREACRELGLPAPIEFGVPDETPLVTESLRRLRSEHRDVSAVAACDDETAFALLAAAHRLGLGVPADLAVMGFGDAPVARHAYPALTTVRVEMARLGDHYASLLLHAMGRPVPEAANDAPYFSVVVRESA